MAAIIERSRGVEMLVLADRTGAGDTIGRLTGGKYRMPVCMLPILSRPAISYAMDAVSKSYVARTSVVLSDDPSLGLANRFIESQVGPGVSCYYRARGTGTMNTFLDWAAPRLDDGDSQFGVMSADNAGTYDLSKISAGMRNRYTGERADLHIAAVIGHMTHANKYGSVQLADIPQITDFPSLSDYHNYLDRLSGRETYDPHDVVGFQEKVGEQDCKSSIFSTFIIFVSRNLVRALLEYRESLPPAERAEKFSSLTEHGFPFVLDRRDDFKFTASIIPSQHYWTNIRGLRRYWAAQMHALRGAFVEQDNPFFRGDMKFISDGAQVSKRAVLTPPYFIGEATIEAGAQIGPGVMIPDGATIGKAAVVRGSILLAPFHELGEGQQTFGLAGGSNVNNCIVESDGLSYFSGLNTLFSIDDRGVARQTHIGLVDALATRFVQFGMPPLRKM